MEASMFVSKLFFGSCILFTQFHAVSSSCQAVDQCSCKLSSSGQYISLWGIDKKGVGYDLKDTLPRGFSYKYSPCTGITSTFVHCKGNLVCQTEAPESFALAYKQKPQTSFASPDYQFVYKGSSRKATKGPRTTTVTLKCDPKANIPKFSTITEDSDEYSFTVTTKCACAGGCKDTPNSASKSGGLSIGSVLCITFTVLIVVYIIGGILINKFLRHKEQSEIIPNKSFWTDFPALVKDGCVFTFRKVKGGKGGYQELS